MAKQIKTIEPQQKGVQVKLTVADRFNIQSFMPTDGSLTDQIQAKSIMKKTDFSSDELEEFEISVNQNGVPRWNEEKEKEIVISLTTGEVELLHTGVKLKDTAKQIKPFMVDIALKIKEWAGCPVEL